MNPVEAAIRAACHFMGVSPDNADGGWRNFVDVGWHSAKAFVEALPEELAAKVREHMGDRP